MAVIDSDAHVIENNHTWDFFSEADLPYKPRRLTEAESADLIGEDPGSLSSLSGPGRKEYWLIDGKVRPYQAFDPAKSRTPDNAREVVDVQTRLDHMDQLGTDVQVLYPTLFLFRIADNPEVDRAVCRSYNRWLADAWSKSNNRLRWVVVPPVLDMDAAVAEIRFGKQNGACGVFMLGINQNRIVTDPYYFPMYEEAARARLAHLHPQRLGQHHFRRNVRKAGNPAVVRQAPRRRLHAHAVYEQDSPEVPQDPVGVR